MAISQRQVVQECFDGDRRRDCNYCPAHYSKAGICCFGQKYEDHDPHCHGCSHNTDCEPQTFQYMTHQEDPYVARPRIAVPRRPAATGDGRRLPAFSQSNQRGGLISETQRPQSPNEEPVVDQVEFKKKPFFEQMGLHALWGAMEGAFEMLLSFLRNRRPD